MTTERIRWGAAVLGAVIAEASLIAAAFGWVAIYSYLINPNQPMAVYERHAVLSAPWVSIGAGIPIFYAASRWIARSRPTALVLVGLVLVFDATVLVLAASADAPLPLALVALSYASKMLASYMGGWHGTAKRGKMGP